uniref:Uncharacterized protein n=1 Tax=Oryza meridionalis TaxID=40149 RepID=A0A0E0DWH8_9ORYZ
MERKLTSPPCSFHRRHRRLAPLSQRRRIPPASTPTLASPCLPAVVTVFLPPRRRIWTWEEHTGLPAPPPASAAAPPLRRFFPVGRADPLLHRVGDAAAAATASALLSASVMMATAARRHRRPHEGDGEAGELAPP